MSNKYGIRKISNNAMKTYEDKNGVILTRISEQVGDHYLSDTLENFGKGVTKRVINNSFSGGYTMNVIKTYGNEVEEHTLYERFGNKLKTSKVEYSGSATKCFEWTQIIDDGGYVAAKNSGGIKRSSKRKKVDGKVISSKKVEKERGLGQIFCLWLFAFIAVFFLVLFSTCEVVIL